MSDNSPINEAQVQQAIALIHAVFKEHKIHIREGLLALSVVKAEVESKFNMTCNAEIVPQPTGVAKGDMN